MHPTIASTPVPEGVTLRFSPTAVNGYVSWIVKFVELWDIKSNILISQMISFWGR